MGVERLAALTSAAMNAAAMNDRNLPFDALLGELSHNALTVFLLMSIIVLLPIAVFGLLVEFLQTGPIFTFEKIQPKLENLNPTAGIKKMFTAGNFIEVIKSVGKTVILFYLAWYVIQAAIPVIVHLPANQPVAVVEAAQTMVTQLFLRTLGVFLGIMVLDAAYQHYAYAKKMRMSISEVKKEHKDSEGDPQIKGQRRQLQQEWSQEGATEASRSASVMVVNPTHIAIAIRYDKEDMPVPTVTAKGQDESARVMRDAANEENVPVLRNQQLARRLLADVDVGDVIPRELFDMVAEIILWAGQISESMTPDARRQRVFGGSTVDKQRPPPGEDLTQYPPSLRLFGNNE